MNILIEINKENQMKSVLEELWYGNIYPPDGCRIATKEGKKLMGYVADHHENLQKTLDDKQKELLEKQNKLLKQWVMAPLH